MKLTIEEKKSTSVDIELPAYYNYGGMLFKLINADIFIKVEVHPKDMSIKYCAFGASTIPVIVGDGQRISEDEFLKAFDNVKEKVQRELDKSLEAEAWHEQEQADLKANALAEVETTQS